MERKHLRTLEMLSIHPEIAFTLGISFRRSSDLFCQVTDYRKDGCFQKKHTGFKMVYE